MTVSAIIPCFNAEATIRRAVNSLLAQSVLIEEIIIVNDGSSDNSLEILRELEKENKQIQVIDQNNAGVSGARNAAITVAQGEFILTLDADDYFDPTFIEKALAKFSENKNYGAVMCGYVRVVNGKKILPYIPPEISLASCLLNNGALSCLLFKKKAIIEAGGYDEAMVEGYEDWDLNIRLLKRGYTFGVVKEILFNYTDRSGSRTHTATCNDVKLRLQMYDKYRGDYEHYGRYHFEEMINQINRLKIEKQKVLDTTSFKLGHKITSVASSVFKVLKKKTSKQ